MVVNKRLMASGAAGVVVVALVLVGVFWVSSGSSPAPGRTLGPSEIPTLPTQPGVSHKPGTKPTPNRFKPKKLIPTPPLSTTSPKGSGLGAPDTFTGTKTLTSVSLHWHPVAGAAGYVVYRDGAAVGWTTAVSFDDTGLKPGAKHTWTVAAYDNNRVPGDQSTPVTLTPGS